MLYFLIKNIIFASIFKSTRPFSASPDCNENPFVPGFGTKDCSAKRVRHL